MDVTIALAALKVVGYGLAAIGPGIGIGVATLRPVRFRCAPARDEGSPLMGYFFIGAAMSEALALLGLVLVLHRLTRFLVHTDRYSISTKKRRQATLNSKSKVAMARSFGSRCVRGCRCHLRCAPRWRSLQRGIQRRHQRHPAARWTNSSPCSSPSSSFGSSSRSSAGRYSTACSRSASRPSRIPSRSPRQARIESERMLEEYKRQLEEAKSPGCPDRRRGEAAPARRAKADITEKAQAEAAAMIEKARAAIEAEKKAAIAELQGSVADTLDRRRVPRHRERPRATRSIARSSSAT